MVDVLLKTNDGRDGRSNLIFIWLGMLAMLRLKFWSAKGESRSIETWGMGGGGGQAKNHKINKPNFLNY